jgi:penicillin-binding protein 1A
MVPNLVTGVWVGGEERATHFKSILYGQGASMALPIWALYMKQNYAVPDLNVSTDDFEAPEEMTIRVDCSKPLEEEEESQELEDDLEDLEF